MKQSEIQELYKVMFTDYPDVVNVEQLSQMLGGISVKTAYRLLKSGAIKSLYVGKRYKIPKLYVLEYLTNLEKSAS
jgi:excisionase family DNA binding protein